MSDTADFSSLTAGNAAVLATGQAVLVNSFGSWIANPGFSGIPAWVRSMLVILRVTNAVGNTTISQLTLFSSPTGLTWYNPGKILNQSGGFTIPNNTLAQPQYFPFYGVLDSAAGMTIVADRSATIVYTIIGLPDADILGTSGYPVAVMNSTSQVANNAGEQSILVARDPNSIWMVEGSGLAAATGVGVILEDLNGIQQGVAAHPVNVQGQGLAAGNGLGVILEDGAGNQQGTLAHPVNVDIAAGPGSAVATPLPVAISDSHPANAFTFASTTAASGAAAAAIMANPAAGQGYEIAAIHIGTATLPTASNQQLQVRSHTTGQFLLNKVALAGQPIDGWITYPPGFVLGEGLDLLNTGIGVTGFVTVLRRTVAVG